MYLAYTKGVEDAVIAEARKHATCVPIIDELIAIIERLDGEVASHVNAISELENEVSTLKEKPQ